MFYKLKKAIPTDGKRENAICMKGVKITYTGKLQIYFIYIILKGDANRL